MRRSGIRYPDLRLFVAAAIIAIATMPVFSSPAGACSCATPIDIQEWVDGSEAVFVGTLVEKRSAGSGSFESESIYVFAVEKWVKGDAGDVIEVRSASDGAGCGFEFWSPDQLIGAAIYEESGELHGGLCSQMDPDALLAAVEGLAPSNTGVGHIIAANGWMSTRLTLLDEDGGHVADVSPPIEAGEWGGTFGMAKCPGGELMMQWTQTHVVVWDLSNLEPITTHEVTGADGYPVIRDASCKTPDASSIRVVGQSEFDAELLEVVGGNEPILALSGEEFRIGNDYVISWSGGPGEMVRTDVSSGEQVILHETPAGENWSITVAPHPTDGRTALLETRYSAGEAPVEATLSVLDEDGFPIREFEIPWEAYGPTWLDEELIGVQAYDFDDWERSLGFLFDVTTGEQTRIDGWRADLMVGDGRILYGTRESQIIRANLDTGAIEELTTLASQSAGPLVILDEPPSVSPTTTVTTSSTIPPLEGTVPVAGDTVPPLEVPGGESDMGTAGVRWIAGSAVVAFLAVLVWLTRRPGQPG